MRYTKFIFCIHCLLLMVANYVISDNDVKQLLNTNIASYQQSKYLVCI